MLNLYKASAGSGKTHKLTGEYLKLLFSKEGDAAPYKHILAVTFTNKATAEMKQRILEELYNLSCFDKKSPFMSEIAALDRFNGNADGVRAMAQKLLVEILNDYNSFNISTIDRFFQQVMRSFAREVGQYSSYNVHLDNKAVLSESVDMMLDTLEDNEDLLKWLIELSVESIENGEKWNSIPKVKELGSELFSEDFKIKSRALKEKLKDKDFINSYRTTLINIVNEFSDKSKAIGSAGVKLMQQAGLTYDMFKNGRNSPFKAFHKWQNGEIEQPKETFLNLYDNRTIWSAKSAGTSTIAVIESVYPQLNFVIGQAISHYNDISIYQSALAVLKNLYSLGILHDIHGCIREYCKRKNIILLSETTEFLNRIIDNSDTPFIYEKTGTRIDNYMLDEFQDTSLMQWDNFRPLIKESLDCGRENLIVGDVKQSIYRWRNSDWKLLNGDAARDIGLSNVREETLSHNWRSCKNIIDFNNEFFERAGEVIQEIFNKQGAAPNTIISDIYSDVSQIIPEKNAGKMGHVSVNFIPNESAETDWKEVVKSNLPATIEILRTNGYELNDIAILVRKRKEGAEVAQLLLQNGYKVISEDSLMVSSSKSVEKIVTILKNITEPDDSICKFLFQKEQFVPKEKSLYNICEEIIRSLSEEERRDGTFIQAFLDCVTDYISLNGSDIRGFVRWWEESGKSISISAPEGEAAVRVITIHKSKGLGFKVVIVPFLDEKLAGNNKGKFLWCTPTTPPFDQLEIIPIRPASSLKQTIFAEDFYKELLYSYIDCINLAYVAFTRAKEELIIYAPQPKENKSGGCSVSTIGDVLYFCFEERLNKDMNFQLGEWWHPTTPQEADTGLSGRHDDGIFSSIPIGKRLKLSFSGPDFFSEENIRSRGVLMHDILSSISTKADLKESVQIAVTEGRLSKTESDTILNTLTEILSTVDERHWFDGRYTHYNEIAVITPDGETYRPDRVLVSGNKAIVIDYKFGKSHNASYARQIERYASLLRDMGYEKVEGYLWYFENNDIISYIWG